MELPSVRMRLDWLNESDNPVRVPDLSEHFWWDRFEHSPIDKVAFSLCELLMWQCDDVFVRIMCA